MSIRVKILMILVLGMLVALTVSTLSFLNAQRLDHAIERILTQDMAALRAVSEARESLRDARRTENLMIAWRDASLKGDIDRALNNLNASIEAGQSVAPDIETSDTYHGIRKRTQDYADALETLVGLLRDGQSQVGERHAAMLVEIGRLHALLRQLQDRINSMPADSLPAQDSPVLEWPTPANSALGVDLRTRASDTLALLHSSLDRLAEIDASVSDVEATGAEQLGERVDRVHAIIDDSLATLTTLLRNSELSTDVETIRTRVDALQAESRGLAAAITSLVNGIGDMRARSRNLQNEIESEFAILTKASWQAVAERREDIGQQRSLAITLIFAILIGGVALVVLLGLVLMRSMTRNFDQLLRAASHIQQGDLDTRVRIPGGDELHRLGDAFNAMARYLSERRKQQIDYNDIVTLLNSTLSTDEILAGSLHEIIMRSGSDVGAFYAADKSGQELTLARGFGLSAEMSERRVYRLGAGLVGQAAKNRRKILVSPVPEGAFDIDIGLGRLRPDAVLVLPVVHVDTLLGVFVLVSAQPYGDEALTFIEEVVFQFGVAYNNARFVATIEATAMALRERTGELIKQRARLEDVNRELENANRLKSDFLANVTHELRTPLNSIIGFSELVLERDDLADKPRRHLDTVLRNARNLLGLINDLLDITRIESGKVALRPAAVDITAMVEDCLQTISPLVDRDRVALESRVDPELDIVHSDVGKLQQVLINLLSNAAKFTEEGAIRVDVRAVADNRVEFAVMDTGIGIHSEDLPFIFDKFRQVDGSTSRKYGGTGLGLAITSELVHVLGGQITARSEPGAGSTFIVVLPRTLQAESRAPGGQLRLESEVGDEARAAAEAEVAVAEVAVADRPSEHVGESVGSMVTLPRVPTVAAHRRAEAMSSEALAAAAASPPQRRQTHQLEAVTPAELEPPASSAPAPALPTASSPASSAPAAPAASPTGDDGGVARGAIIVIDDMPTSVVRLREGLVNDGFEIKSAFVYADALALLDTLEPSAVVLGRPLPEDDAEARLTQLAGRLNRDGVPVILLGDIEPAARSAGLTWIGTLGDPIDPEAVLALLEG